MHIGKNIKKYRLLAGLTQEELSNKINKTTSLISHIENSGNVSILTLRDIATALNLNPEELEHGDNINNSEKDKIITKLKIENEALTKEIQYLKEIIELLKRK